MKWILTQHNDRKILINVETQKKHYINRTLCHAIQILLSGLSFQLAVREYQSYWGVSSEQARSDLDAVLRLLGPETCLRILKPKILYVSRGLGRGHAVKDLQILERCRSKDHTFSVELASYATGLDAFQEAREEVIDLDLPGVPDYFVATHRFGNLIGQLPTDLVISHEEFSVPPASALAGVPCLAITHWFLPENHPYMKSLSLCARVLCLENENSVECPASLDALVRYCSTVSTADRFRDQPLPSRDHFGIASDRKLLVIAPGSGASNIENPFLCYCAELVRALPGEYQVMAIVGDLDEPGRSSLDFGNKQVAVLSRTPDLLPLSYLADCVITNGSYTILRELESIGVRHLAITGTSHVVDTHFVTASDFATGIDINAVSPVQAAELVLQCVDVRDADKQNWPPACGHGADRCAVEIFKWIREWREREWRKVLVEL